MAKKGKKENNKDNTTISISKENRLKMKRIKRKLESLNEEKDYNTNDVLTFLLDAYERIHGSD